MVQQTERPETLDWKLIRAFVAVMEEGTLSAAAQRLGATQPTLGRQIRTLEAYAGDVLFIRRGLRLEPTGAATALLPRAREIEREIDALARTVQTIGSESPGRKITLTAPTLICDEMLPALIGALNDAAPGARVEVVPSDTLEDIHRRSVDITLRMVRPTQPDLITRKLGTIDVKLFASRAYVDRMGRPDTPLELAQHDLILPASDPRLVTAMAQIGLDFDRMSVVVMCDDLRHRLACMRADLGISTCHDWIGQRDPDLVPVLPALTLTQLDLWLVATDDVKRSRALRGVFDLLAERVPDLANAAGPDAGGRTAANR